MKKLFASLAAVLLLTASVFSQAPEKMSYQAVVRDGSNNLVTSTSVGMKISILQGSANGTAVYAETQTPTSNANGLVSLEIGAGTIVSGDFTTIDWSNGPYFIKTETDPTGGTSYSITGTSQLLSVPYALHAKTAEKVKGGIGGVQYSYPASFQSFSNGEYAIKTLTQITMIIPEDGYVLLTLSGYSVFFSQNRTLNVGIGTTPSTILYGVSSGYLDGSSTHRFQIPFSITNVIPVTAGTQTFYALVEGNSVFNSGSVNVVPVSFIGVFFSGVH